MHTSFLRQTLALSRNKISNLQVKVDLVSDGIFFVKESQDLWHLFTPSFLLIPMAREIYP